ncbi:MAG: hypothetical protein RL095_1910 [Verrucomicrobiota bacterium]|jgi:N-acetylneuraminate lyase
MKITGLVPAAHSPFKQNGELDLSGVASQVAHYQRVGLKAAFICGSTGESHSLKASERKAIAEAWMSETKGKGIDVIVHVGSNCLEDACELTAHAEKIGAKAFSALTPSYFKPANVDLLVATTAKIAGAAPSLPFYFYDIPVLTGVNLPMDEYLEKAASQIPNLVGIKFTNPDLMQFQLARRACGGRFDLPFGNDEFFLAAYALGAKGAVGSTFNFAPNVYTRLMAAFDRGDHEAAREEQFRSVLLVKTLAKRGYLGASKALLRELGCQVGYTRLPLANPSAEVVKEMLADLKAIGYFEWR